MFGCAFDTATPVGFAMINVCMEQAILYVWSAGFTFQWMSNFYVWYMQKNYDLTMNTRDRVNEMH